MQRLTKNSLFVKLTTILTLVVVTIITLNASYAYFSKKEKIIKQIKLEADRSILSLQHNIVDLIESYFIDEYQKILKNEITNSHIFAIILEDYNMGQLLGRGGFTTGYLRESNWQVVEYQADRNNHFKNLEGCYYQKSTDILSTQNRPIAKISICFSDHEIKKELEETIRFTLIHALLTSMILIISIFFTITHLLVKPIAHTITALEDRDSEGIPINLLPHYQTKELKRLSKSINQMILGVRDSRLKLRAIIRNIPDLLWIKDVDGRYLACNRRFEDLYGAKEEEIIGKSDYDFVEKKLADFFREHDNKAMQANRPLSNFEEVTFASDGHQEYLHTTKTKILDIYGNIYGVLGIGRDITKIRDYQNEIEKQKGKLQTILDTTKDGIAIISTTSQFLFANQAYLDMVGYAKEEILTKRCFEMFAPNDMELFKDTLLEVLEKGFVKSFEKDYYTPEKQKIKINMSIALMPDLKSFLIATRDVTQIRKKEKLIKDYVEIIDENIITSSTDLNGVITYVSHEFCRVSGFSQEELIGQAHDKIRGDNTPIDTYKVLWDTIKNDKKWTGEFKNRKKDGSFYWIMTTIAPIYDIDNQKIGYTAISQDITDKKIIEEISITDGLTQIYNRRYFNKMLPKV
ncbi:MAG: PAS domain S-box protein, partial [Campylobacterota bacterium]|nr:PAS domain S-box protein [Campylobacterota bacterium]